jgi:UDP:flavonoid glycosyltransferase YjiC (YdhE family)
MSDRSLRVSVAAVGPAGHLFPALALARALARRGATVTVLALEEWRATVVREGLAFIGVPAYSYLGFPPDPAHRLPAADRVAAELAVQLERLRPDVAVTDWFSIALELAAELAGIRRARLIPYHYTVAVPGQPFFTGLPLQPVGFVPARSSFGRLLWRALHPLHERWRWREREARERVRQALGLVAPSESEAPPGLTLVASLPQLEYPRAWPPDTHVTGPMLFDPPHSEVELPEGEAPLVAVAPSTLHDPGLRLVGISVAALADEPVRVIASLSQRGRAYHDTVPDNVRVVDWASYAAVFPHAALVISHGGHGTVVNALARGVPVLVCPEWGDQADNGARLRWAGAGLTLPHALVRPRTVRLAVRRLLGDERFAARAREIGAWVAAHDGATRGAELVESYAGTGDRP